METDKKLLEEALQVLGAEYQHDVAIEELSCAVVALIKKKRNQCSKMDFIEALADAELMIEQLVYNNKAENEMKAVKILKLDDLERKIAKKKENPDALC